MEKRPFIITTNIILLIIICVILGINSSCTKDIYNKYIVEEGVVLFSFEYPSCYTEPSVWTDSLGCEVKFSTLINNKNYEDVFCTILINFANEKYIKGASQIEDELDYYRNTPLAYPEFQLLYRGKLNISSKTGEEIVFTYKSYDFSTKVYYLNTVRDFYANYDNYHYKIGVKYLPGFEDEAINVYHKLIKTFQILD